MPIRSAPAKHSPERTIRNKSALYGFWDTLYGILKLHTQTLFSLSEVSELLAFAIKQEANRLKMKYQTDDPYEICRAMKIQVMKQPMILDEVGATPEDFIPRMIQELATAVEFDLAAFRAQVKQKSTCKQ